MFRIRWRPDLGRGGAGQCDQNGRGKPEARKRFLELVEAGWSTAWAAGEVGVNVRTAQAWRDGLRKSLHGRWIRADGTVVTEIGDDAPVVISDRYLSLPDRLATADGLAVGHSVSEIAARIGKHKSTVSREARVHRVQGLYLPYPAHRQASLARARPKASKLVGSEALREAVEEGCRKSALLNRSPTDCATISPTTKGCG